MDDAEKLAEQLIRELIDASIVVELDEETETRAKLFKHTMNKLNDEIERIKQKIVKEGIEFTEFLEEKHGQLPPKCHGLMMNPMTGRHYLIRDTRTFIERTVHMKNNGIDFDENNFYAE